MMQLVVGKEGLVDHVWTIKASDDKYGGIGGVMLRTPKKKKKEKGNNVSHIN